MNDIFHDQVMALINPRQVEHLKKMQPMFRFKERHVTITPPAASQAAVSPPTPSLLTTTPSPVPDSTAPSSSSTSGSPYVARYSRYLTCTTVVNTAPHMQK